MRRRVLVVDDEEPLRYVLEDTLAERYDVATADSGAGALARLDDFRPDVVLLDFNMPGVTGLDVLREIRARDPGIQVVMVSGTADPRVVATARQLGAFAFLPKPFLVSRVVELVGEALAPRAPKAAC